MGPLQSHNKSINFYFSNLFFNSFFESLKQVEDPDPKCCSSIFFILIGPLDLTLSTGKSKNYTPTIGSSIYKYELLKIMWDS